MKSFVRLHTTFFVDDAPVSVDIHISVKNLSLFLQSFDRFYKSNGWHLQNRDLPLHFYFDFVDFPSRFPNKLIFSGLKPDIRIIAYCNYIYNLLSKTK